ncbi:hypothetical protein DXT99_22935 [Pontibacter diazotrophicus]|uniref:Lipocalin-like domain-containing protein n=1 Tax=Pontibacter diazotrophicus TaxID=1400979 RepID=A0A3D8L3C7_9BACT|nr:hypothetical protein [Pontibacter diazotrophicus]RDV11989.1 hypothetical protein DXT99_22935 [Pontibacter diazotrophicus]
MKKLHLIALLLVVLCTFSLTGCKDDDENVSPRTAFLTDGVWRGDGIYVRPTSFLPFTNVTSLLRPLGEEELADQLDITTTTFEFERDGTFTATRNGDTQTGSWEFTNNEQSITISGDDIVLTGNNTNEATFDIVALTETQFTLDISVSEMGYDLSDYQGFDIDRFELRLVK